MDTETKQMTDAEIAAEAFYDKLKEESVKGIPGSIQVRVTPELAKLLLANNPDNRNLRENKLTQLISDIRENRWKLNGESLVISKEGLLNDGQHRLTAVVKTGIAIHTLISYGVERDTRDNVDVGAARRPSDMLGFYGLANASTVASTTRLILQYEKTGHMESIGRISNAAIVDRATKDEVIRLCSSWAHATPPVFQKLITASVAATVFYLLQRVAPLQAKQFMETFRDAEMLTQNHPVQVLRNRLMMQTKLRPNQKVELALRAWNQWAQNKESSKLQLSGEIPAIQPYRRKDD